MVRGIMTDIDPYPVSELQSRYNIGKQAVYNRLEALKIKPEKQGNRSYVNYEQLEVLDGLDEHIARGGDDGRFPITWKGVEFGASGRGGQAHWTE
jgi:hypothetical protein